MYLFFYYFPVGFYRSKTFSPATFFAPATKFAAICHLSSHPNIAMWNIRYTHNVGNSTVCLMTIILALFLLFVTVTDTNKDLNNATLLRGAICSRS